MNFTEDKYELNRYVFALETAGKVVTNKTLRDDLLSLAKLISSGKLDFRHDGLPTTVGQETTFRDRLTPASPQSLSAPARVNGSATIVKEAPPEKLNMSHVEAIERAIQDNNGPSTITHLNLMTAIDRNDIRAALKDPRFHAAGKGKTGKYTLKDMHCRDVAFTFLREQVTPQTVQSIAVKLKCELDYARKLLDHEWFSKSDGKFSIAQT